MYRSANMSVFTIENPVLLMLVASTDEYISSPPTFVGLYGYGDDPSINTGVIVTTYLLFACNDESIEYVESYVE